MRVIEFLKDQHRDIERELIELEEISRAEEINYPNLIHVFKNLTELWDKHELLEEDVFKVFEKEKIKIPVEKMMFDHSELRSHKEGLKEAIRSGSETKLKESLDNNVREIIDKLRKHISYEDEILYTLAEEEFTEEEIKKLNEI